MFTDYYTIPELEARGYHIDNLIRFSAPHTATAHVEIERKREEKQEVEHG